MISYSQQKTLYQYAIVFSGIVCACLGVLGIIGWDFNLPILTQLIPQSKPLLYNTAVIFVFAGVGITYQMISKPENSLYHFCVGSLCVLIGVISLIGYQFTKENWVESFFSKGHELIPKSVSPITALGKLFIGLSLLILSKQTFFKLYKLFVAVFGLFLFSIGLFICFVIFSPERIELMQSIKNNFYASFPAAIGYIFAGIGLTSISFYNYFLMGKSLGNLKFLIAAIVFAFFMFLFTFGIYSDSTDKMVIFLNAVFSFAMSLLTSVLVFLLEQDQLRILELKNKQEFIKNIEENFHLFVEATRDWIWAIDKNRKITFSNSTVKNILGYRADELLGVDILLLLEDDCRHQIELEIEEGIEKKKRWFNLKTAWKHKNGLVKYLESSAEPVLDMEGALLGFKGAGHDVTEHLNLEKIKNEFVSMVSHELRTPLTSIRGAIGLLINQAEDQNQKKNQLLEIAYNNCERLMGIIHNILEIERLEAGRWEVHLKPIEIGEFIRKALVENKPLADKFQVELVLLTLPEKFLVYADYDKLLQVMANLISNAVKYSSANEKVFIKAEASITTVRVSVHDRGPGIPEELRPYIFEKFSRDELSSSLSIPGTGLGLRVCKFIISSFHGSINFMSRKEFGTVFYFDLPKWCEEAPLIRPPLTSGVYPPLLVFSNDQYLIDALDRVIKEQELVCEIPSNSTMFFRWIYEHAKTGILLDLDDFNIDYLEHLKRIYISKENNRLPLILLTENLNLFKEHNLFKEIPVFKWIEKPVNDLKLDLMIKEIKDNLFANIPCVLYVDENRELIEIVKALLFNKVQIFPAKNLQECSEILKNREMDLILLDDKVFVRHEDKEFLNEISKGIPKIVFSSQENLEEFPNEVKRILDKYNTTNQDLIETIESCLLTAKG